MIVLLEGGQAADWDSVCAGSLDYRIKRKNSLAKVRERAVAKPEKASRCENKWTGD